MDQGEIVEQAPPERFFSAPQSERTRLFLGQILDHGVQPQLVAPSQLPCTVVQAY